MRKAAILMIAALVLVLAGSQVFSGESCTAARKTSASAVAKTSDAKMSMASVNMTPEQCAQACGMSAEECKQFCADHQGCGFTRIDIKGMTGSGCEQAVTTALSKVEGVQKVLKVDHKEGYALVCTMMDKVKGDNLIKAISDKGYTAEIIPAATGTTVDNAAVKSGCDPKTCAASAKGGCCAGKGSKKTTDPH
ncbi:MAG TPA: cation transporter [candidate division Zixibacteria bacterium]|nr:cation transporter [candidate division Zixibacteria bacterium]